MKIKNIAQYEETDSELAKYTICDLQNRINEAIEYINFLIIFNQNINGKFSETLWGEELLEILKGDSNE